MSNFFFLKACKLSYLRVIKYGNKHKIDAVVEPNFFF